MEPCSDGMSEDEVTKKPAPHSGRYQQPDFDRKQEDMVTDRPIAPWELPGNLRRDCESDHHSLIKWLNSLGLCALLPLFPAFFCVAHNSHRVSLAAMIPHIAGGMGLALTSIGLGVSGWALARQDIGRMRKGMMDRAREEVVRSSGQNSAVLTIAGVASLAIWGLLLLRMW
jgi:hypothetical protein